MSNDSQHRQRVVHRILTIDDNDAIHNDFRKTLCGASANTSVEATTAAARISETEDILFGKDSSTGSPSTSEQDGTLHTMMSFELDSALQGEVGYEKVRTALAENRPYSVAFVDMRMPPGWDGLQTIQKLWEADPRLQIVVCTAYSDYSWEEIVRKLGWTDQLLILKKPFDTAEVRQIAAALTQKWEMSRQAQLKMNELEDLVQQRTAELRRVALHDKLTGLPNRMLLRDRLGRALERAKRDSNYKFGVLFLDFDRFKVINDSLGHEIGDLLLIEIARRLEGAFRGIDSLCRPSAEKTADQNQTIDQDDCVAARLGGDEFVVIVDELREPHEAARVAERLLALLAQPYVLKGREVHTTASIGITTNATPYAVADDMIRDADTAMYRAKAAGKANYVVFDEEMHRCAVERLTLEHDLRKGIDQDQIEVHYQPIVSLRTGRVTGFEALARWTHPTAGRLMPSVFIPIAEETGLIVPLGVKVMNAAWKQLAVWRKLFPNLPDLSMSVNLSRKQFASADLLNQILLAKNAAGVDARHLRLEITESSIMQNPEQAALMLREIRDLQIQLLIDDFGTGYSSLSCLHQFPVSGLKIDKSFIKGASERPEYAAVLGAIVMLTRTLDLDLIAEGIETTEQVRLLQSLNCDQVQGFLFAKPMSAKDAEEFLFKQSERRLVA